MKLHYDTEGDILYIDFVERHEGQISREIGDGLLAEVNRASGATEGLEIWNFSRRASQYPGIDVALHLPISTPLASARAG